MITTSFRVCDGVDSDGWESGKTLIFFCGLKNQKIRKKISQKINVKKHLVHQISRNQKSSFRVSTT